MTQLKAIGITCGIGSMLCGARQAGFEIVGNVEWRRYYHAKDPETGDNTFMHNYPNAIFKLKSDDLTPEEVDQMTGADIALGHPECGNFSRLGSMNPDKSKDPADIPLFVELVARFKPRFFVMDDLPGSFAAYPMSEYAYMLPDYDLYPEWISNWGYGNVQKNRNRMFMIGSLREERWAFRPGEEKHELKVMDMIGDLPDPGAPGAPPNHTPHTEDEICARAKHVEHLGRGVEATYADLRDWAFMNASGQNMLYHANDGTLKRKPAHVRCHWDGPAHVLDGTAVQLHYHRGLPYSIRERARIQGFPDDFVFIGEKLNDRGEFNHEKNNHLIRQTGKAMPIHFCRYVSKQIAAHINGEPFESSGERVIKPNPMVNDAKQWYCREIGYADQKQACANCWLYDRCAIRHLQYGIGDEPQPKKIRGGGRQRPKNPDQLDLWEGDRS